MKIHFSVDDFIGVLQEATVRGLSSVFQHPIMSFFQRMHIKYGMNVSCYCFLKNEGAGLDLRKVTDAWKEEFQENADWLKFGFHGLDPDTNYGSRKFQTGNFRTSAEEAAADYNAVIGELIRITGGGVCIDRMPRIHYYAGTKEACLAWKNAEYGIEGLLTAEDDRYCYYHDQEQYDHLLEKGELLDEAAELRFVRTNIRLENTGDIDEALNAAIERYPAKVPVVFTHEKYLYDSSILEKIEECMKFCN